MKVLLVLLLAFLTRSSYGDPSKLNRRISEKKCDEYKNLVNEDLHGECKAGDKVKPEDVPHFAVIGSKTRKGVFRYMCVGSLISKSFVIAVSHCVELTLWHVNAVRLGKNHSNAGGQEHEVKKVISHPQYDRWTSQNDIALVELAEDVTFTNFIRPACLQVTENFSEVSVEVGWEEVQTTNGTIEEFMQIELTVIDRSTCFERVTNLVFADEIFDGQMCAVGKRSDVRISKPPKVNCRGKSGNPLQVQHPDIPCVFNIVGILSVKIYDCNATLPSIYASIPAYISWIEENVWPLNA